MIIKAKHIHNNIIVTCTEMFLQSLCRRRASDQLFELINVCLHLNHNEGNESFQ